MNSESLSSVSTRRRPPWPTPPDETKSRPFVPTRDTAASGESVPGLRARRRRAGAPASTPPSQRRPARQHRAPRVRRRLRPGGLSTWLRRVRLPLALLLGLCAAATAMLAVEGSEADTTAAIRLSAPVAAGETLTEDMLEQGEVDAGVVPDQHSGEMEDYVGRTAATSLPEGAVVHTSQLVGPGLLEGFDGSTVAVTVRPADGSMIEVLSPGQRVDVTTSSEAPESENSAHRIAEAAPVLWIPQREGENWLQNSQQDSSVVIIGVDSSTARDIAEASHRSRLHLSLVGSEQ